MTERETRTSTEYIPQSKRYFYNIPVEIQLWRGLVHATKLRHLNKGPDHSKDFITFAYHLDHALGLALLGQPVVLQVPSSPDIPYRLDALRYLVEGKKNKEPDSDSTEYHLDLHSVVPFHAIIIDETLQTDEKCLTPSNFEAPEETAVILLRNENAPVLPDCFVFRMSEGKLARKADPRRFPPEVLRIALSTDTTAYPDNASRLSAMIGEATRINPNGPIWLADYAQILAIPFESCMGLFVDLSHTQMVPPITLQNCRIDSIAELDEKIAHEVSVQSHVVMQFSKRNKKMVPTLNVPYNAIANRFRLPKWYVEAFVRKMDTERRNAYDALEKERKERIKEERLREDQKSTKNKLRTLLIKTQQDNPKRHVNLSDLARTLGCSRERVHKLYWIIAQEQPVPPLHSWIPRIEDFEAFDKQVAYYLRRQYATKEIAAELFVNVTQVIKSERRIRKERRKQRHNEIIRLKKTGYTYKQIMKEMHIDRYNIEKSLKRYFIEHPELQKRKKYRTREEAVLFRQEIAAMWEQGLMYRQIADRTGDTLANITTHIGILQRKGVIQKRK